jgi:hypothetical protein
MNTSSAYFAKENWQDFSTAVRIKQKIKKIVGALYMFYITHTLFGQINSSMIRKFT